MMSKCANPNCPSVFRYLRDGKLFQVPAGTAARVSGKKTAEQPKMPTRDEFFWLCGPCSKELTIHVDPVAGVHTVPLELTTRAMRAAG
jgi:hypothetical protein